MADSLALAVLRRTRALLTDPSHWSTTGSADDDGRPCEFWQRGAARWTLVDALHRSAFEETLQLGESTALYLALTALASVLGAVDPGSYHAHGMLLTWSRQPERTHAEILDLLDRAIAQAGGVP